MTSVRRILLRASALLAGVLILLAAKPTHAAPNNPACSGAGQSSQTLYVATSNKVFVYSLGETSPRLIITGGLASVTQIATDAAGKRYVSNFGTGPSYADSSVTEYERGHTSPTFTRTVGAFSASGVAVDAQGNVFVSSYYRNTVSVYHPGQVTPFLVFDKGITSPDRLAVSGTSLYVAESGLGEILQFSSGSPAATPLTLTLKPPDTLPPFGGQILGGPFVVGSDGTVYASGAATGPEMGGGDFVNVFAPDQTSPRASAVVFTGPSAQSAPGVAVRDDDLYAATNDNNAAYQYEVDRNLTLVRTITTGLNHSGLIALDAGGCLYAGNIDDRVTVYPPGATKPSQIITVPGGGPLYTLLIGH